MFLPLWFVTVILCYEDEDEIEENNEARNFL